MRVFAIDNISSSKILDQQTAKTIDPKQLEQFLTSSYGIFSCTAQHIASWNPQNLEPNGLPTKAGIPTNKANGNYQLGIFFNDSRELIMDILKHGAEVEVKTSGFLREAVIQQIAAMQKSIKNKSQPHVLRLSVWIMEITLSVGAET